MAKFTTIERWAVESAWPWGAHLMCRTRRHAREEAKRLHAPAPVKVRIEAINPRQRRTAPTRRTGGAR